MPVVPSIRATPTTPPPLDAAVELTLDDAADVVMHRRREAYARFRRFVLILGLPVMWFLTLLGLVANWMAEPGVKGVAAFLRDMGSVSLTPVALFLAVVSAATILVYLLIPGFLRWAARDEMRPVYAEPIAFRYRLDRAGIAISEPLRSIVVPWSWLSPLQSTDRVLYFPLGQPDQAIVFPRRALSGEATVLVRRWAEASVGVPGAAADERGDAAGMLSAPAAEDGAVRLTYELTVADHAAAAARDERLPATRNIRRGAFAILFVLLSLIWPAVHAFAWIVDPYRVPFADAFPLYLEMFGAVFWKPMGVFAVLIVLALIANRFLENWQARNLGERRYALARGGGVRLAFDATGIHAETAQHGACDWLSWGFVEGIERGEAHIFLRLKRARLVVLPLRAFEGDTLARFEALVAEHLPSGPEVAR